MSNRLVIWIDGDAADFFAVHHLLRKRGLQIETALSLSHALQVLGERAPDDATCLLLDAFVPIGSGTTIDQVLAKVSLPPAQVSNRDVTGHWILHHQDVAPAWRAKTIVLSAYTKTFLIRYGFPEELLYFHKDELAGASLDALIDAVVAATGGSL